MDPQVSTLNPTGDATPEARRRMALSASNSASKAFTSAGAAACCLAPPAPVVVDRGFHGFHVPGASGSERDCDTTGTAPSAATTIMTADTCRRRVGFIAEDCSLRR